MITLRGRFRKTCHMMTMLLESNREAYKFSSQDILLLLTFYVWQVRLVEVVFEVIYLDKLSDLANS